MMEKLILPANYDYFIVSQGNDEFIFRVKQITDEPSALAWLSEFSEITKSTWRVVRTYPKSGRNNIFKVDLRCVHNTDRRVTGKGPSKHTGCPAKITIVVKRVVAETKAKIKDVMTSKYPTIISIREKHNHALNTAETLKHRDLSEDIKLKFIKLFQQGHSVTSALKCHKTDLMLEHGEKYYLIAVDRKYMPSYSMVQHLFKKEIQEELRPCSKKEMLKILKEELKLKLALIQCAVSPSKERNFETACLLIKEAAQNGAKLVCLPECFNVPFGLNYFHEYAEFIPGCTSEFLSRNAKENNIYLIGGTFPERDDGKLFNTCLAYGPDGELLTKYRKVHIFDFGIPGNLACKESDTIAAGPSLATFTIGKWKIGLGISSDIRFPLMANIYAEKGCNLLVYPGTFNMTTGPVDWELLQRARAADNQLYVATISPARDEDSSYQTWGHSTLVGPRGSIVAATEEKETVVYGEIDAANVVKVREQIPIQLQKRNDLYHIEYEPFDS